jgi:L-fuconolactonase
MPNRDPYPMRIAAVPPPALDVDARIDAHTCLWREAPTAARAHPCFPGEQRLFLPQHLRPILARTRFDAAILVSAGNTAAERAFLGSAIAAPLPPGETLPVLHSLVAGWSNDLPRCSVAEALHAAGRLAGVWMSVPTPADFPHTNWRDALDYCQQKQISLEMQPADLGDPDALLRIVGNTTRPVVLAHLGGAPEAFSEIYTWMGLMRELAVHPHVYLKLSALHSAPTRSWGIPDLTALFSFLLEQFGPERLMFGSDWPYCLPDYSWKECLARFTQALGPRSQDMRNLLLGATAQRAYSLGASVVAHAGAQRT